MARQSELTLLRKANANLNSSLKDANRTIDDLNWAIHQLKLNDETKSRMIGSLLHTNTSITEALNNMHKEFAGGKLD
jgi:hypothetical protein